MKCAVMIMLVCLVGTVAAEGYSSTQNLFLRGENPVRSSMDESNFADYADMYWASYLSNPDTTPRAPLLPGQQVDVENTMAIWRISFPLDVSNSSFGDGGVKAAGVASPRYDFGIGTYWRYTSPMPIAESSFEQGMPTNETQLQRNTEALSREVTSEFGL